MKLKAWLSMLVAVLVSSFSVNSLAADVPAVIYLQYLNQNAPALMCQQDSTFACLGIPQGVCEAGVKSAAQRCGPSLLQQWPESFAESRENAIKYSAEYRQCILEDWITQQWITPDQLNQCEPKNTL